MTKLRCPVCSQEMKPVVKYPEMHRRGDHLYLLTPSGTAREVTRWDKTEWVCSCGRMWAIQQVGVMADAPDEAMEGIQSARSEGD